MKHALTLSILAVLLFASCEYDSPLTKEHSIAVDASVLGLWEPIPDEGEEAEEGDRMMILSYSETEYLIHHPVGKHGLYFRGYPIRIGGVSCVQLQVIGTKEGPIEEGAKERFLVVSYELAGGKLEVKILNPDLVDSNLKTMAELVKAFLTHKDNKELFTAPERFQRVK